MANHCHTDCLHYPVLIFSSQTFNPKEQNLKLVYFQSVKSLPDGKILDESKFKAFAGDKLIWTQRLKLVLGTVGNIEGKGENAGYQNFLLFPQCFQKLSFPEVLKVWIVW